MYFHRPLPLFSSSLNLNYHALFFEEILQRMCIHSCMLYSASVATFPPKPMSYFDMSQRYATLVRIEEEWTEAMSKGQEQKTLREFAVAQGYDYDAMLAVAARNYDYDALLAIFDEEHRVLHGEAQRPGKGAAQGADGVHGDGQG